MNNFNEGEQIANKLSEEILIYYQMNRINQMSTEKSNSLTDEKQKHDVINDLLDKLEAMIEPVKDEDFIDRKKEIKKKYQKELQNLRNEYSIEKNQPLSGNNTNHIQYISKRNPIKRKYCNQRYALITKLLNRQDLFFKSTDRPTFPTPEDNKQKNQAKKGEITI